MIERLTEKLSEFGTVEICSAKKVFTLLMTGEGLDKMSTALAIQEAITEAVTDEYCNVEQLRNSSTYYCIVLSKPKPSENTFKAVAEQISIQSTIEKQIEILKAFTWKN